MTTATATATATATDADADADADAALDALLDDRTVSTGRRKSLRLAIAAGAPEQVLCAVRDAARVCRQDTIVLPPGRLEHLSRGRGWARQGRGPGAIWGERVADGYRVGPGRWVVGSTDGFARKCETHWTVRHVTVGGETWTIAS